MKTGKLITLGVIGILVGGLIMWGIGLSNTYNKKFVTGKAFQQNCEVVFDNTWKTIKSEANVTDQYKESFRQIYVELMDARYKNDAGAGQETLMKWVQESNPQFDASLYTKLMNTIEGTRENFTIEQKKLIDIDRELKSMKVVFPASLILGSKPDLEIKLVTSGKTKEAFATGEDNDVNPFDNTSKK